MNRHLPGLYARWGTLLYLLGLALILLTFYWPAASLQGVFYVGDIYRLNYPLRALYAQELGRGSIPLWAPEAMGGYPILADGQTGAYYPLNLLLYRWLPLPAALNYSILISFWIAGAGLFLYVWSLGLRRAAAFLAACVFMLGGFMPAHLNHLNMLAGAAWLPLLLWSVERATRRPHWQSWALVAALFGLQGLAGHPQVSLLSALLAAGYSLASPLVGPAPGLTSRRRLGQLGLCCGALVAGGALALVQWLPTYELVRLSQRERGLNYEFFTSFSLPPNELLAMLWPFRHGNPFPAISQETVGYVGILPIVLAAIAPLRRRDRVVAFWTALGVLALLLVIGRFNPLYHYLQHIPVLNSFRAPARYLLWLDLAIAVLAGAMVDSLLALPQERLQPAQQWAPLAGLAFGALFTLQATRAPLDRLLATWRWLPLIWLAASVLLLTAILRWRAPARPLLPLALALVLIDLGAFVGVQNQTYNDMMPVAEFNRPPAAPQFLQGDTGPDLYRVYTDENWPGLPVMRESLYPNIALLHGMQSLNGYFPLVTTAQEWLQANVNPRLLDLLNVRYVLVPQQQPKEGRQGLFLTDNRFARSLAGRSFILAPRNVAALEVEGFLIPNGDLPVGTPVAEVVLHGTGGERIVWTLRAGRELAPWWDQDQGAGSALEVVRTWMARFEPAGEQTGHTYLARHRLAQPLRVGCIEVRALIPQDSLRLERLRLVDPAGGAACLPALAGEGDHTLAFCSSGVAIYRNGTAGPRAFLAHRTRIVPSEQEARQLLTSPGLDVRTEVILPQGRELAGQAALGDRVVIEAYERQRVRLRTVSASPAYLVLADSYYPGWVARLDGRPVTIERADVTLRAIALPAGEHRVEFTFQPRTHRLGQMVSLVGWLAAGVLIVRRAR